jgi:hypothetical protein
MMDDIWYMLHWYSWLVMAVLGLGVLVGLFLRRRSLAARATRIARGEDPDEVTPRDFNRARIQFLLTLGTVVLLFLIWGLQKFMPSG